MEQKTNLSAFMKDVPVIKVTVSGTEIYIRLLFSLNCCEIMFEQYEQSADYKSAFINAVYHMYQKTNSNKSMKELKVNFHLNVSTLQIKMFWQKLLKICQIHL